MLTSLLLAALGLPLLLYIPGFLLSRTIAGITAGDLLERHYERVVSSTLLSGWLAFLLAELGIFSLWILLFLLLLCCGLLLTIRQQLAAHRKQTLAPAPAPPGQEGLANRPYYEILCYLLIAGNALLLFLPPFEVILGVRDAGVYSNTGFAIARTGNLVQYDDLLAELGQQAQSDDPSIRGPAEQAMSNFLGVQHPERFIATRMRAAGFFINEGDAPQGRVVPQGFHLLPAWIALLTSILGLYGGLFVPGLMGLLGAWSVGMLGRRLAGNMVGILAMLFLVLNSVQIWFARYSTSETTTQFLTFAGLYCFAKFQTLHAAAQKTEQPPPPASLYYAALAGIAFGQFALTRIDFFLVVGPALIYLLFCWLAHRWNRGHTALALGMGAMLLHAGLHVAFIARAYFFDTAYARLQDYALTAHLALPFLTPLLREVYHTRTGSTFKDPLALWRELAVVAAGVGVLLALWRWPQPLHALAALAQRWSRWLTALMALGLLLIGAYTYLVRPQILSAEVLTALPACLTPQQLQQPEGPCLTIQGYVGAPIAIPEPQPAPDPAKIRQENPVTYYEAGLRALLSHMEDTDPRIATVTTLQDNLLANINQMQQSGDTPELQRERTAIISQLDGIAQDVIAFSFEELCKLNIPTPKKDDKYVIPKANLVRVGWYLSPLGVALGIVGFALWCWRGLDRRSWLFLLVGLLGTFFYIRQTYGTSDQTYIYILRRFVPIAYPTFSLAIAYALAGKGRMENGEWRRSNNTLFSRGSQAYWLVARFRWVVAALLVAFFVWTGRPLAQHTEYAGAIEQLETLANRFEPDDILLFRGGGPTYGAFRDVPDLITTPLHFIYGLDALTVKSSEPGNYAALLARQVQHWQQQGRTVYMVLSASGGDFVLPGFRLQLVGHTTLDLPEFEQLTNQKPRNVSRLMLPLALYMLQADSQPDRISVQQPPIAANDFAAQVQGFYLAEHSSAPHPDNASYAWTDGDALLRIPWREGEQPAGLSIQLAGGERPSHLGAAEVCLSIVPEAQPWPQTTGKFTPLGCLNLSSDMHSYRIPLDKLDIPAVATGSALLRMESATWIPAEEDPRQVDQRTVGIQFGGLGF